LCGGPADGGVIGRFPWDPFPPGEPTPEGADPLLAALYRGSVEGADAYRQVRSVLRLDGGTLRVGNRFVAEGRYREVAFVAVGHAASSMALAALHVFGDRLTQGFVAGPEEPPASVPFRSVVVEDGWGGAPAVAEVVGASQEIASGLRENDLFLLLVSPGAVRALLLPPTGLDASGFADLLVRLHDAGATAGELSEVVRVLGTGGVGGRLVPRGSAADVQCLIVDRGDGPVAVGGGPAFPVRDAERQRAREVLERAGLLQGLPATAASALSTRGPEVRLQAKPGRRPVVVSAPEDALRGAADVAFDKGWTARVGEIGLQGRPEAAADRFLARVEAVLAAERGGEVSRTKGIAIFSTLNLDLPEGVEERPTCEAFLARASSVIRRREMSVGLWRTAGPTGGEPRFSGAAIGAPGDPKINVPAGVARRLPMRRGITDVGLLAVALLPLEATARPRTGASAA
jgi:glycerate-2-kinase